MKTGSEALARGVRVLREAGVPDAGGDARRLLAGLVVVALPEAERARLLERVGGRARAVLPAEVVAPVVHEDDEDGDEPEPRRLLAPLPVLAPVLAPAWPPLRCRRNASAVLTGHRQNPGPRRRSASCRRGGTTHQR